MLIVCLLACSNAEDDHSITFPGLKDKCVNDFASVISSEDSEKIKALCEEISEDELAVIVVATIDSIPKVKKEYDNPVIYGTDLFNLWQLPKKGILILISIKDRKTAICTGYTTEYFLPDSEAGKILDEYMIPQFKEVDYGAGIITGILEARKVMEKNRKLMYPEKYGQSE